MEDWFLKPIVDGYEENSNWKDESWDDGMAGTGHQATESVDNIDLPSHARVSVTVIVNHIWPRIIGPNFHVGSLAVWNHKKNSANKT
jgi:hypothetical protein